MQKIRLNILGLSVSQTQSGAYALVLAEENGERRIPIIIGPVEAQAIAIQLEGLKPPRPLTHDLIKNMAMAFDIALLEVTIYKLEEGIFYSELLCEMNGKEIKIDSRTSDAVALALRFRCPIYTTEDILKKSGIILDLEDEESPVRNISDSEEPIESKSSTYSQYSENELNEMINEAVQNEDYEKASIIRDELRKEKNRKSFFMKHFLALLVIFTGILFFQPVASQNLELQPDTENQQVETIEKKGKSDVLLTNLPAPSFKITSVLRGILGMAVLLFIGFVFSNNRKNIPWKTVITGLIIQIILAIGVLYVPAIRSTFEFFGQIFVKILDFTKAGSEFLLGDLMNAETYGFIFLFQVLPTIIFFSALTSLLFYWGIIQKVVYGLAWVFTKALKISGAEALSVAGNIFLGQTESPLMIKAYLDKMSKSEILLVMTGGMATLAGGVLAAYIALLGGNDPQLRLEFAKHLLAASVMAAPAAIIFSKMLIPPTDAINKEITVNQEKIGSNVLDAISNGTTEGVKLAVNVGAMLLAFIAFIAMFNFIVGKIGQWTTLNEIIASGTNGRYNELSLQFILGYTFSPLMWLIGVSPADIVTVGRLLGEKLILTEFIGYISLSELKASGAFTEPKSIIMATYILCGFANFSSIGIQIGGIGALAPGRRVLLSKLGMHALLAGTLASLMSATIIGAILGKTKIAVQISFIGEPILFLPNIGSSIIYKPNFIYF